MKNPTVKILGLLTAAGVVGVPASWAQQATLEEIVVTAERREANLQETPISIMAFSGADLQEMNLTDLEDLQAFVPNISVGGFNSGNIVNWVVRGVGSNQTGVGHDRGVGLYIDDVYFSQPVNSLLNVVDVERVEVLRGPQGTLFGRNTTGGAVRYVTQKPTNEFEGTVTGTVGSFSRTDVKGVINLPFSDTVYGRFTLASLSQDGWVTQISDGKDLGNRDDRIFRGQIRVEPSDSVTIDFNADYVEYRNDGAAQYMQNPVDTASWYNIYQGNNPGTPDFPVVAQSPDCDFSLECSIPGVGFAEFTDGETSLVSGVVQWQINDTLTFKSVTASLDLQTNERNDWDLSVTPIFAVGPDQRDWEEISQEFQLNGVGWDDRLNWTAGLYFSDAEGERFAVYNQAIPNFMGGQVRLADRFFHAETANQAAFFDATARLTEQFAITAGIRYTEDEKSFNGFRTDRQSGASYSAEADWDDTIGRFVLEYFPRDGIMIYGSYSEGYKAGFIADQIVPDPTVPNGGVFPFNQENVETVELGLRSEWWDNRLRFNFTLFDTDYTDLQVDALSQVPDGMGSFEPVRFITNAGDVAMDGWELDFLVAATESLQFDVSMGHLEHEIVRLDPTVNFPITGKLPRAPEDSWKVGVRYDVNLANGGNIRFGLDHGFTDTQRSFFGTSNTTWLPEYELTNARVTYAEPNGAWAVALFCTNCSDEWYLRGQHDNQRQWGGADTLLGKPRMYGLEFNVDF